MRWTAPSDSHSTSRAERHPHLARLRLRPGRGAGLLCRQARPRSQQRSRPWIHALVDRPSSGAARTGHSARETGPSRNGRSVSSASSRAHYEGRVRLHDWVHDIGLQKDLSGAPGQRRRVHTGAGRAALRHRRWIPRPIRQSHSNRAAEGLSWLPTTSTIISSDICMHFSDSPNARMRPIFVYTFRTTSNVPVQPLTNLGAVSLEVLQRVA